MSGHITYASITYGDPNPVKRWLQNRRLDDAIDLIPRDAARVVDYGGGDGMLTARLTARRPGVQAICFEPAPVFYREAEERLRDVEGVSVTDRESEIADGWAHAAVCAEVFEHLPPQQTESALDELSRILAPGGVLVVGVPVEVGAPALVKGVFRCIRRPGGLDAKPAEILRAALRRPHGQRYTAAISEGRPYHPLHIGFDHAVLAQTLARRFDIVQRRGSPWRALPSGVNSEIYFVARKR